MVLAACGGSGSGSNNGGGVGTSNAPTSNAPTVVTVSGTFVDAAVNGLNYIGRPSNTSGVTGTNGTAGGFTVVQGDTVTFSIGTIEIGSTNGAVTSGQIVTPAELAGDATNASDSGAIRIARLLQSLDDDGNTANGITITTNTINAIAALTQTDRDNLQASLTNGSNFETLFGGFIDNFTAGNTVPRAEGNLVSAMTAATELLVAVNLATGGRGGAAINIITVPDAPVIGTATAGDGQATAGDGQASPPTNNTVPPAQPEPVVLSWDAGTWDNVIWQ
jgi:hypothetical protein